MIAARQVSPELLDILPAGDRDAIRSRQDIQRCNALMLQAAIMTRLLCRLGGNAPRTMADIGAGDGTFMLGVARRMAKRWPGVSLALVERQNIVADATLAGFARLGWRAEHVSADVFDFFAGRQRYDIVTANLFLHHFPEDELSDLIGLIAAHCDALVACEPRRGPLARFGTRLLWAIGCNHVTRHDGAASVRAGFRGRELSALWPGNGEWERSEQWAMPFTHTFAARRRRPGAGTLSGQA